MLLLSADIFSKLTFSKYFKFSFGNTIRVSNGLDPVGLDLGPNNLHLKVISTQQKLLTNHFCNYCNGPYAEYFCVFRHFISRSLAALLFRGA